MKTTINSFLFLVISILFVSCSDEARHFEQNAEIKDSNWDRSEVPEFTFDIEDTNAVYHLIYTVRNGKNYPYYNLFLESELIDSTGLIVETFFKEVYLFDANTGEPNGTGTNIFGGAIGDIFDGRYMCKSYFKFPKRGTYTFNIKQYMRQEEPLSDVIAIGLRVEKVQAN